MFIEEFAFAFKLKYIINRCGVLSGPLQFGKQDQGFVSLWIWKHLTKQKLQYIGYGGLGNQVRDVLHINDFCELIEIQINGLKKIYNRTFTVGGSNFSYVSLKKLTELCTKITGNKMNISRKKQHLYTTFLILKWVITLQGVQLPIAGFRGSGLAWMVDILSGVLTGGNHAGRVKDPFDDFSGPQNIGHLFITFKTNLFVKNYNKRIKDNIKRIKRLPKIKGIKEIMYPGQNKYKRFKMNSKKEIKISEIIKKDLEILKN